MPNQLINQKRTPDPLHKAELIRAGLSGAVGFDYHYFRKLHDGGGHELIHAVGSSHELQIIPPPSGGYTPSYVKV